MSMDGFWSRSRGLHLEAQLPDATILDGIM
jgi:hypothetical protein